MVRRILIEKRISKTFWLEEINWTIHILNRSPTLAKKYGCVTHAQYQKNKRKKLDDKS